MIKTPDQFHDSVLSIVVGTYNRRDKIERCIESVINQTSVPFRLFVTDAGSEDGTQEYLRQINHPRVTPIFEGKLSGQAKAYNDVFAQVESPYVCWISDDNLIVNQGLDTAVAILRENPSFGMVGLKVKDLEGPFVKAPYIGGISEAGILNVNQGMLPTDVLRKVGGFSETFRNYGIDPDITAKVLLLGLRVAYTRDVVIHHERGWAEDPNSAEGQELTEKHARSLRLYREKYSRLMRKPTSTRIKQWLYGHAKKRVQALNSINSNEVVAGGIARDWHNVANSHYVSPIDVLRHKNDPFHLVQQVPRRLLPKSLPSDPTDLA